MKFLKPIMFAVAGFAIAFLVAFKNEEPKKEYAFYSYSAGLQEPHVFTTSSEIKYFPKTKDVPVNQEVLKLLEKFSQEGWEIKVGSGFAYFLQRTKP